jgi:hypothetical protein
MSKRATDLPSRDPYAITHCQRLTRQLQKGIITYEEYTPHMTDGIISAYEEDMPACLQQVPADLFLQYAAFLRAYLEPVDYMPMATQFVAGDRTEESHEAKKRELRPKYLRLMELVQKRLQSMQGE